MMDQIKLTQIKRIINYGADYWKFNIIKDRRPA